MADLKQDYDAAVKRLHDRHDVMAEMADVTTDYRANIFSEKAEKTSPLRESVPTQSIAARIADLAKQVAEVAMRLSEARSRHREVSDQRSKCETLFAQVSEELVSALNEHRAGPPEGVRGRAP